MTESTMSPSQGLWIRLQGLSFTQAPKKLLRHSKIISLPLDIYICSSRLWNKLYARNSWHKDFSMSQHFQCVNHFNTLPLLVSLPSSVLPGIWTHVLMIRSKALYQRASWPVEIVWILGRQCSRPDSRVFHLQLICQVLSCRGFKLMSSS